MKIFHIQPSAFMDNAWVVGEGDEAELVEGHRLPYPFDVKENGQIWNQRLWQGKPTRVVGFSNTPDAGKVDLWWQDAVKDSGSMVNKYVITQNKGGAMATHTTAIQEVRVLELPDDAVDE
jgi:hypothetical protein